MKLSKLQTDTMKKSEGTWVPIQEDLELKLAYLGEDNFQKRMEVLKRPHKRKIEDGTFPPSEFAKLTGRVIAETIVKDWRGLEDDDGKAIKYTKEKALELFTDPNLEDLRDYVVSFASNRDNFRVDEIEEAEKN